MNRIALLILCSALLGCGANNSQTSSPTASQLLLKSLSITEWNISHLVGKDIRIEGPVADQDWSEFRVTPDMRLVTQVSDVNQSVIVYVLSGDSMVSTFAIRAGAETTGLRSGSISNGTLYEFNGKKMITIAKATN